MENYVGKRIDGRYEIQDVIGVGGMAVVYKAYDNIDDRIVAVKILKDEYLANEEFRRRFKNESKAIAVMSHRNIVKVYDVSFGDRLQYIVMEHIEGITLKEYIEEHGVIDWNEALFFSIQILRALQHAHDKGIVHRDVKPQNIMLLQDGTIKVTDFGIARFSHSETRTMTEKAIGSVHYISPEQAKGELTDEKADIYSVGVVLYEMLTGRLPFEAESAVSVALMQVNNEAELPRTINPRIPVGFEQITMKAMQKSTRERYQSAAEMLFDLEELKRNPRIKFDYQKYYVDDEPTRYIGKIQENTHKASDSSPTGEYERVKTVPPVSDARKKLDDSQQLRRKQEEQARDSEKKTKTIAIAAGVGVAVVCFLIVLGVIGLFKGGKKIEVADFYGMSYEEIMANIDQYQDYDFEPVYEQFSDGKEGCVFKQDPEAGTKAKKGVTVRLYIAKSGQGQIIPDLEDQNYLSAQNTLENMDFVVKLVAVTDSEKPVGNVVRTEPAAGESVLAGSYITIYYSASASTGVLFDMPNVVGMDINAAEKVLKENGLVVGTQESVDSSAPKGQVVQQSIEKGTPVQAGDTVNLTISSGRSVAEIFVDLPANSGNLVVKVMLENSVVSTETVNSDVVTDYRISVPGNGKKSVVKVYLNDKLYYEAEVDYRENPADIIDEKYYSVNFYVNVVGMNITAAQNALREAGYTNITIVEEKSTQPADTVIKQSPTQASAPSLDTTATIVLTVAVAETMDNTSVDTGNS